MEALGVKDDIEYIETEMYELEQSAKEFNIELKKRVALELTAAQKGKNDYWYAGLSLSFPIWGQLVDRFSGDGTTLGAGTSIGTILSLISFLKLKQNRNIYKSEPDEYSSRQKAFLFMNKLWDIRESK